MEKIRKNPKNSKFIQADETKKKFLKIQNLFKLMKLKYIFFCYVCKHIFSWLFIDLFGSALFVAFLWHSTAEPQQSRVIWSIHKVKSVVI